MDEVLLKRLVGVVALILAAMLLTSILPTPGQHGLDGEAERVVTMDLTRPDSMPVEQTPPGGENGQESAVATSSPADPVAGGATPTQPAESGLAFQNQEQIGAIEPPAPVVAPPAAEPKPEATQVPDRKPVTPAPPPEQPARIATPASPPKKTAPVEAATPKSALAKTPTKPATTGPGKWQVQAGAYSQLDRAEAVRSKARAAGVSCLLSPAEAAQGGTLYRVRCGPYGTRVLGEAAVRALARSGIKAQVIGAGG